MINRREMLACAVALVATPAVAFQLPEDRLISKARIVMEAHVGDTVNIRDSLLRVFESEQKYWSSLNVKYSTGEWMVDGDVRVYPMIVMVEYLAFGETTPKYIRIDPWRHVLLTDEEHRDRNSLGRNTW